MSMREERERTGPVRDADRLINDIDERVKSILDRVDRILAHVEGALDKFFPKENSR